MTVRQIIPKLLIFKAPFRTLNFEPRLRRTPKTNTAYELPALQFQLVPFRSNSAPVFVTLVCHNTSTVSRMPPVRRFLQRRKKRIQLLSPLRPPTARIVNLEKVLEIICLLPSFTQRLRSFDSRLNSQTCCMGTSTRLAYAWYEKRSNFGGFFDDLESGTENLATNLSDLYHIS